MRIAPDTNILLYGEGVNGQEKQVVIRSILARARQSASYLISTQACAELFHALTRKFGWERPMAQRAVAGWQGVAVSHSLSVTGFNEALSLSTIHELQMFDAMILCAAIEGGCTMLLSEDMQHGFSWRGLTIVNPFAKPEHPALLSAMNAL